MQDTSDLPVLRDGQERSPSQDIAAEYLVVALVEQIGDVCHDRGPRSEPVAADVSTAPGKVGRSGLRRGKVKGAECEVLACLNASGPVHAMVDPCDVSPDRRVVDVIRVEGKERAEYDSVTVHDAVSGAISGPFTSLATLNATDAVHNHLVYGYTGGLGVDVNLIGGLFMRAEWEYIRFTSSVDTSINTVRAGLGYKF